MTDNDNGAPDPFGPEDYAAVKTGIERALEDAHAAGRIGSASDAEAAQFLREGLEQLERDHGLNVVRFPGRTAGGVA